MKVLQLIQKRQNRGAETFACQLSTHLKDLSHEVKIVSMYDGDAELNFSDEIETLGASLKNRFFDYQAWKRLSKIIESFEPDIVQANAGDTLKYAVFSKIIGGWKAPIVFRNASEVGQYLRSFPQKVLNAFFLSNTNHVISVSKASEIDILNHFKFLKGKTSVIPVGLEKNDIIENIHLNPPSKKHIVHVGGFSFEKNHKGILAIFERIHKTVENVHLHLIGDGPSRAEIEERVGEMDIKENVSFYGFVTNPLSYIKAADVLILPSLIEGLPGVLLEAMYCKTPVIAYNVGGIGEIVTADTGTLISVNEEEQFAHATIDALNYPSPYKIENGYQMVTRNFMNRRIAIDFIHTYETIKTCNYPIPNNNVLKKS